MIIFDEYLYGETINKRDYINDKHPETDCLYLARYLLDCGEKEEHIRNRLKDIINKSEIVDYRSYVENLIKRTIREAKKRKCKKFVELVFYKKEIEKIKVFQTIDIQKVAFAYLSLYKFFNAQVTAKKNDIMEMMNINYSGGRFRQILNILTNSGFLNIDYTSKNNRAKKITIPKAGYTINLPPDDTEVAFIIRDYKNISGSFMEYLGNPTFQCSRCGGVFEKVNSVNTICKDCKRAKKLERERERYKNSKKG